MHLLAVYAVCSFNDIKKKTRMNVQHYCSSVFVFMNESSAWMHTGFGIAHFLKTPKIKIFSSIL